MRSVPAWALAAACLPLAALPAAAAEEWSSPLAQVIVEDRFERCAPEVAGVCVADVSTPDGSVGNATVDAHHELRYAGVATNASFLEEATGADLPIPHTKVGIDFSSFYVPYPVFILADGASENVPWADERYRVGISGRDVTLHYHGVSAKDPSGEPANQTLLVMMFDERRGFGYDRFRLVNAPGPWVSDREFDDLNLCAQQTYREAMGGQACWEGQNRTAQTLKAVTPALTAGAHFHQAEVATAPEELTGPSSRGLGPEAKVAHNRTPPAWAEPRTLRHVPSRPDASPNDVAWRESAAVPGQPEPTPERRPPLLPLALRHDAPQGPGAVVPVVVALSLLLVLLAAALFSRFQTRHELLASPVRSALMDLLTKEPGMSLAAAARHLGLTLNGMRHHARLMAKAGVLRMVADRHRVFLYPVGTRGQPSSAAYLRRPLKGDRIVATLAAFPHGLSRAELRALLPELPERTRNHRIQSLVHRGVIRVAEDGDGSTRLRLVDALRPHA